MADTCNCEATEILIFPCSGGSNVGQIANQAGVELTKAGVAKLYCLAGIGAIWTVLSSRPRLPGG